MQAQGFEFLQIVFLRHYRSVTEKVTIGIIEKPSQFVSDAAIFRVALIKLGQFVQKHRLTVKTVKRRMHCGKCLR